MNGEQLFLVRFALRELIVDKDQKVTGFSSGKGEYAIMSKKEVDSYIPDSRYEVIVLGGIDRNQMTALGISIAENLKG